MLLLAFPLSAIILGIINILIVVALLLLVGYVILWIMGMLGFPIPDIVQKIYMAICALIALYMLVALLFGIPTMPHVVG